MEYKSCSRERFIQDVAEHELTIIRDEGPEGIRHLSCKKKGTNCYRFEIVCWPGYLTYYGDMGCWVFSRVTDMLSFFRGNKSWADGAGINPYYWGQKIKSEDVPSGTKTYSEELFHEHVRDHLKHLDEIPKGLLGALENELLDVSFDSAQDAMTAAMNFEHEDFVLQDFWEHDLTDYTLRYIWCCYALVWAIDQYDQQRNKMVCQSCKEKKGTIRMDHGLNAGVHCDVCWDALRAECRQRSH